MKKSTIILVIITILIFTTIFLITSPILTGKATQSINEYTYTKAICNDSNFCQDNIIICQGNKTPSIQPITGAAVQHSEEWQDPRDRETIERLC